MDAFLNILVLFFAMSGLVGWAFALACVWFYWMCRRSNEE
jgi:hypothetical protein